MNRHIVIATMVISLFAFFSCNLICDIDELRGTSATDSDSDSDVDINDCEGGRYDESTGLCWQHPEASGTYEWQEAIDYCDDLDLAVHTDWYLPSRDDFIELLGDCDGHVMSGEDGYCNSCDESDTCSALFGSNEEYTYWSSPWGADQAWYVRFSTGYVEHSGMTDDHYVRCVRAGP